MLKKLIKGVKTYSSHLMGELDYVPSKWRYTIEALQEIDRRLTAIEALIKDDLK